MILPEIFFISNAKFKSPSSYTWPKVQITPVKVLKLRNHYCYLSGSSAEERNRKRLKTKETHSCYALVEEKNSVFQPAMNPTLQVKKDYKVVVKKHVFFYCRPPAILFYTIARIVFPSIFFSLFQLPILQKYLFRFPIQNKFPCV